MAIGSSPGAILLSCCDCTCINAFVVSGRTLVYSETDTSTNCCFYENPDGSYFCGAVTTVTSFAFNGPDLVTEPGVFDGTYVITCSDACNQGSCNGIPGSGAATIGATISPTLGSSNPCLYDLRVILNVPTGGPAEGQFEFPIDISLTGLTLEQLLGEHSFSATDTNSSPTDCSCDVFENGYDYTYTAVLKFTISLPPP